MHSHLHICTSTQLVLTGKINDVGAYTRTNIDKSYRAGIELQGGATLSTKWRMDANLALSRNKLYDFTEFIDVYDAAYNWVGQQAQYYRKTDISFSPDVVGSAILTFKPITELELSLLGKYVSSQYLDNTSNEARMLDAYYTQDARAIYTFSYKKLKSISLIGQVYNVFNTLYEPNGYTFSAYYGSTLATENYYFPMAGTNWVLGLNIKL